MHDEPFKERKSRPAKVEIEQSSKAVALREATNALRQFDLVIETIDSALTRNEAFELRPSFIQTLNRLAIEGISDLPGVYRPGEMTITNSRHEPPPAHEVAQRVEELCDYVNKNWDKSPWHLAAYIMWRLNWIHPFEDGNGRTSRALSYAILCIRLGQKLPGNKTIPDHIAENKKPYYQALEKADEAVDKGHLDVSVLEEILKSALAAQLVEFHHDITGQSADATISKTKLGASGKNSVIKRNDTRKSK